VTPAPPSRGKSENILISTIRNHSYRVDSTNFLTSSCSHYTFFSLFFTPHLFLFLSPPRRTLSLALFSLSSHTIHCLLFLTPFRSTFSSFFLPGTRFATGRPSLASSSSSSTLWTPAPRATRESYCRCVRTQWHTPTHHSTVARHGTRPHTTRPSHAMAHSHTPLDRRTPWHTPTHHSTVARHGTLPHTTRPSHAMAHTHTPLDRRTPWHTPTHRSTVARHGTNPHTTRRASLPDA
jgi:hypothetical protein